MNSQIENVFFSRREALRLGIGSIGILIATSQSWASACARVVSNSGNCSDVWAKPVAIDGVPNLHRVSSTFYRSAQPTRLGFSGLQQQLGVRRMISLRKFHADDLLTKGLGFCLTRIPMNTWHIETEDVITALGQLHLAQTQGPVLLHCLHGADRTGLISALYRILYQDWSKADALAEMRNGGFGFHAVWGNIPNFIKKLDKEAIKAAINHPANRFEPDSCS